MAAPSGNPGKLAHLLENKLLPQTFEPFSIVTVKLNTLTVDEIEIYGIYETTTVDGSSTAPDQSQKNCTTKLNAAENCPAVDTRETEWSQPQLP